MKRYAIVRNARTRQEAEAYLPDNYKVVHETWEARNESPVPVFVIEGTDNAGWTLGGYVIPRYASGLIWAEEIDLTHPIMDEIEVPVGSFANPQIREVLDQPDDEDGEAALEAREFNAAQARAERQRARAEMDAEHALVWLRGAVEKGTGSVPWVYDLNEALGLLTEAQKAIGRALQDAVDPDTRVAS
jgi:hypothetical protein